MKKYEKAARTVSLSGGKSLYDTGRYYKIENLRGAEVAYGQHGAMMRRDTEGTYSFYANSWLHDIPDIYLPGGLSFGSAFEEMLRGFSLYDTYLSKPKYDYYSSQPPTNPEELRVD